MESSDCVKMHLMLGFGWVDREGASSWGALAKYG